MTKWELNRHMKAEKKTAETKKAEKTKVEEKKAEEKKAEKTPETKKAEKETCAIPMEVQAQSINEYEVYYATIIDYNNELD